MCVCCSEIADKHGYGVVEHFVGHGVGKVFHSAPSILHNRELFNSSYFFSICVWSVNTLNTFFECQSELLGENMCSNTSKEVRGIILPIG